MLKNSEYKDGSNFVSLVRTVHSLRRFLADFENSC